MKKQVILYCLLLATLFTSGCWDRTEMNDIALVMASGYDLNKEGKIVCTLQIAMPTSSKGGTSSGTTEPFIVQSMTGDTVHDSFVKIQERLSRTLYEGHRRVIVVGEKMARHGLDNLLDQFSRDPKSRFRSYIVIAKGMEARDLLNQKYPFERVPAEAIRELEKPRVGFETTMRDYLTEVSNAGIEPVLGVIEKIPTESDNKKTGKETFHLAGTAVFSELKLIGYLNDRDTRAMLWVKGERPRGIFTASIPKKGYVSVEMREQRSNLKTEVVNGKAHLYITITGRAAIHENGTKLDLSDPDNFHIVKEAMESSVKKRVSNVVTMAQRDFHQDIFGFGRELHRYHRDTWHMVKDDWNEMFSEADVTISANLNLLQMGLTRAPLHESREEIEHK